MTNIKDNTITINLREARLLYPSFFEMTSNPNFPNDLPKYRGKFVINNMEENEMIRGTISKILLPFNKKIEQVVGNKMCYTKGTIISEKYNDDEYVLSASSKHKFQKTSPCGTFDYEKDEGLFVHNCFVNVSLTLSAFIPSKNPSVMVVAYINAIQYVSPPDDIEEDKAFTPQIKRVNFPPVDSGKYGTNNNNNEINMPF
jgi:hypothetical protein